MFTALGLLAIAVGVGVTMRGGLHVARRALARRGLQLHIKRIWQV